jgi:integrase
LPNSFWPIDEADIITTVETARKHGIPGLERHNDGISENRGRNVYAVLSILFRWLQARRRVLRNVCRDIHHAGPPSSRARVLSNDEIRWLWRACDAESLYGPLVELLILKGQRLNEIAGMRRSELNDENKTLWTIPAARTKNHREHLVPVVSLARDLLANIKATSDLIFTTTGETPLSGWNRLKRRLDRTMLKLARQERDAEIPHWQFHDLRRTFVTGCSELGIRPDVIEICVNHQSGSRGGVAGTYNKSQLLPERKEAFERWTLHVTGIVERRPANVTRLADKKARHGKA